MIKTFNPNNVLTLIMLIIGSYSFANDTTKVEASLGADMVSHYVWRGQLLGNSPSIQPTMGISYSGISFGSWGSYSFANSAFQEAYLYVTYNFKSLTLGVNDYFTPNDSLGAGNRYFDYNNSSTAHTLEPFITLSNIAGTSFSATAAVFAFGNDKNNNGKNQYSTYLEINYNTNIGEFEMNFIGGATFAKGYYAKKLAVVNLGTSLIKQIKVTDSFSIPFKGSFIINPNTENVFLVLDFSF